MSIDLSWLILAFFVLGALLKLLKPKPNCSSKPNQDGVLSPKAKVARPLKARSEDDCPLCRLAKTKKATPASLGPSLRPWRELKSHRGRPKQIQTEGFACSNRGCQYYGIKDQHLHALVGDGKQGKIELNQTFKCQACKKTFSARRHTPLYRLKTPASKVSQVLMALAEGVDLAACERIFGFRAATIATWLSRAGQHSQGLHARFLVNLSLPHRGLDEIRTRLRSRAQVLWLWLSIEPTTKLLPNLALGERTQKVAHQLIHQIKLILEAGVVPIFTSDGLNHYYYALSAHFGGWTEPESGRKKRVWQLDEQLIYGQLIKSYCRRKLAKIRYVMRAGLAQRLSCGLKNLGFSGRLNTAFIERLNLTVRHSLAALSRRSWSTAQSQSELVLHLEWWRAYYHFARPHHSLRIALGQPLLRGGKRLPKRYRKRTPAMAAGLTERVWSVADLLSYPLPPLPFQKAI
jgi:IS1 family transposase